MSEHKTYKIALVISSLRGGGAERVMSRLANRFSQQGHEVLLITFTRQEDDEAYTLRKNVQRAYIYREPGISIIARIMGHFRRGQRLRKCFKQWKPEVILSFMLPTNNLVLLSSVGLKIRVIVSERTNPAFYSYQLHDQVMRKLLYRFASKVVVQTENISRWLRDRIKMDVAVIPNFVVSDANLSKCRRERCDAKPWLISVGRLAPEKAFDSLIKAFAMLKSSFPNWELQIVGEGAERKRLEALILNLGLIDCVHLHGFVANPGEIVRQGMVYVQPSWYEGFPNALLEAMALELPVIASSTAGEMLIKNEVNGLLYPAGDIDSLATLLKRLMIDPDLRTVLGKAAGRVTETHDEQCITQLWDQVLFQHTVIKEATLKPG